MHDGLEEFKLDNQVISPDPERIKFCQSLYNSRIQTSERKAFGLHTRISFKPLCVTLPITNYARMPSPHAVHPVAQKPQTNVNLGR